nr:unnamed protein product [Digitaria exilis]
MQSVVTDESKEEAVTVQRLHASTDEPKATKHTSTPYSQFPTESFRGNRGSPAAGATLPRLPFRRLERGDEGILFQDTTDEALAPRGSPASTAARPRRFSRPTPLR